MQYYATELKEIIEGLQKESTPGKNVTALDVTINILQRYYLRSDVEDLTLINFIRENYEDRNKFAKLIDDLIQFSATYNNSKTDTSLEDALDRAKDEKEMNPQGTLQSISSFHFLLGAMKAIPKIGEIFEENGAGYDKLVMSNIKTKEKYDKISSTVESLLDSLFPKKNSTFDADSFMESMGFPINNDSEDEGEKTVHKGNSKTPMLDKYAKDLTQEDHDPVYGRESELSQLLEILGCKKKNNAILIGEPGVGKTSVVELLATRIKERNVPKNFLEKKIYSLDLNALVAGTKYRGQYEERLQAIIEEVVSSSDIIIFIDEIHNLIGNGGSEGNGDAANILKPYLAKGKFQCIGSTTYKEYRKYIEKDGALKRRFQNIRVDEPTAEETRIILREIKDIYEKHHNVVYPKEVLDACVSLSGRYMTDRYFPDKAIDALDLSGSLTRLSETSKGTKDYLQIEEDIKRAQDLKCQAVSIQDFQAALVQRDKEVELRKSLDTKDKPAKVKLEDVYMAIGKRSGVPLESIGSSDLEKLRKLSGILQKEVIGQEKAIREVIMSLQKNSLSIRDPKKPIASLLFVGPTGSGKTYLCKTLAKEFFGTEDSLIKFDMSEYGEKHEITKLTGASASYIGYEDEPRFEEVRKHPYSVVLFDEIEKAAPEIYQIFLSILDEGYVTLANGVKVDFKNTIIIFTGNIGTKELSLFGRGMGYDSKKLGEKMDESKKDGIIKKSIEKTFAPEFINRLSKIVMFSELGKEELLKIADLEISKLSSRLKESKITVKVGKSLKEHIISECDLKYGARDLQRGITKWVEEKICEKLLFDETLKSGKKTFILDYKDSDIVIEVK